MNTISVEIKNITQDLPYPSYQTEGSSGVDLYANIVQNVWIEPERRLLIPTGIKIAVPGGFEAQVRPRSGLALKKGITVLNTPGTIDSDYREEVGVILINHGKVDINIHRGERIAQLVFCPIVKADFVKVTELSKTTREGGFGSTGV